MSQLILGYTKKKDKQTEPSVYLYFAAALIFTFLLTLKSAPPLLSNLRHREDHPKDGHSTVSEHTTKTFTVRIVTLCIISVLNALSILRRIGCFLRTDRRRQERRALRGSLDINAFFEGGAISKDSSHALLASFASELLFFE